MTKDEIKALVAAKIAGQGSMVDIGGALSAILDAIVDAIPEGGGGNEPLVVNGTFQGGGSSMFTRGFTPNSGEPTFNDALSAFRAGTPVILKGQIGDNEVEAKVLSYGGEPAGNGLCLGGIFVNAVEIGQGEAEQFPFIWLEA